MAYTTIDKPSDYFNTVTYVANQTDNRQITVGFQPDWTWLKDRDQAVNHDLYDSVRGATKYISSNKTNAEGTQTDGLKSFNSTGFTLGTGWGNQSTGDDYVSWNWKAGTSFTNDASATGIGTIDSSGSASDTSGFSIVSYTGTGSAGTIKHGLSSVPYMMIIKKRNSATDSNWMVYHKSISGTGDGHLWLDLTNGRSTDVNSWNNTAPTSSVFSIGTRSENNASGSTYISYCFAEKKGYSKFGSYTGNGNADGTFVYTGQKSAFVMIKATDATKGWVILDNKRNPSGLSGANTIRYRLFANTSAATSDNGDGHDFYSNGFKHYGTDTSTNQSGTNYIYMAFAENPFVTSTGVPACAR